MACWHLRRYIVLEDEFHVLCSCPEYDKARRALIHALAPDFHLNTLQDVLHLLSGATPSATEAFGIFLARAKQTRRKLKLKLEDFSRTLEASSFAARRAAWRIRRKPRVDVASCSPDSQPVAADAWPDPLRMLIGSTPNLCRRFVTPSKPSSLNLLTLMTLNT